MNRLAFLFLFIGVCSCLPQQSQVETFRQFLKNSVHGEPQEPVVDGHWENSGKFEGDIILTPEQQEFLVKSKFATPDERNALLNPLQLWPNKVAYYKINTNHFTSSQITMINKAIETITTSSCVKMVQATSTTKAYMNIRGDNGGCYSYVGYTGGVQDINYASGCFVHGTLVHEMLHALGFHHMQCTWDRDTYVRIVWDKIQAAAVNNFEKYDNKTVSNLGVAYDYGSVMHYPETAFSTDGSKTIVALKTTDKVIGQRVGPSAEDIQKLKTLYKC